MPPFLCLALRRERGREAGLRAGCVHRGAPCARQVGVTVLREDRSGTGTGRRRLQGDSDPGLLAHLIVAKFMDHPPLHRKGHVLERAVHLIPRPTPAQWVGECGAQLPPLSQVPAEELRRHVVQHADETPVAMLKTSWRRAYRAATAIMRALMSPYSSWFAETAISPDVFSR